MAVADAKTIAAAIREYATGTVEWRVQHPVEKSYCISFNHRDSLNPERKAREWLAEHKAQHPGSQFAGYEVAEVRWFSRLESAALEAADLLDPAGVAPAPQCPKGCGLMGTFFDGWRCNHCGETARGVSALPTPKLCPGCAQYHGRNDCPVGWLAPAEPYGVPASEYLAKVEADPRRAAALQRARDRTAGVATDGGRDA